MRGRIGAIFMLLGAACFLIHRQRGGCIMKKRGVVSTIPLFFIPLILAVYPPYSSPLWDGPQKSGGTIATPPETGEACGPA